MENNTAIVCNLGNLQPIDGADKIVKADVILNDVAIASIITGIDTQSGMLVVYFDSNMCLSDELVNDMPELTTYLARGNRVRTIKLKGIISSGLAVDAKRFMKYTKELQLGQSFTELGKTEICFKYTPQIKIATPTGKKNQIVISRMIPGQFAFHGNTNRLERNLYEIKPNDIITISRKIHGTSAICANVFVQKKLSLKEKIAKKLGVKIVEVEYDYLFASRSVVKNGGHIGFYGTDLWSDIGKKYFQGKLHNGETIYYEIYGYTSDGAHIQKGYDYGCKQKEHKIIVYRITMTNNVGVITEYGWATLKERCKELDVQHAQEFYFGRACDLFPIEVNKHWNNRFVQNIQNEYLEKQIVENINCKKPDEGVVIRIEGIKIKALKAKSKLFDLEESKSRDNGDIDTEETA